MSGTHTHPHPHDHANTGPHADPDTAPEAHAHAPLPAPSREGSVVLEIGGDLGALIIHTGPEQDGLEIEVSLLDPEGAADAAPGARRRTHAAVRPRHLAGRTVYCAVISPLPAGRYTVWRDTATVEGAVEVPAGGVAEHRWA